MPACSSPPRAPAPAAAPQVNAESELVRFFPLENGTVFSYDTSSETSGAKGVLIVQISRPREGRADLRMGARTERLQIEPDGIAYVEGGYLLKAPLVPGATWRARSGTAKIAAVEEHVEVPAGKFDGCLRVVEETRSTGLQRNVSSVYCPHVGLVMVDVQGSTPEGEDRETAVLKSFGPRVDLTSDSVTTTTED